MVVGISALAGAVVLAANQHLRFGVLVNLNAINHDRGLLRLVDDWRHLHTHGARQRHAAGDAQLQEQVSEVDLHTVLSQEVGDIRNLHRVDAQVDIGEETACYVAELHLRTVALTQGEHTADIEVVIGLASQSCSYVNGIRYIECQVSFVVLHIDEYQTLDNHLCQVLLEISGCIEPQLLNVGAIGLLGFGEIHSHDVTTENQVRAGLDV